MLCKTELYDVTPKTSDCAADRDLQWQPESMGGPGRSADRRRGSSDKEISNVVHSVVQVRDDMRKGPEEP